MDTSRFRSLTNRKGNPGSGNIFTSASVQTFARDSRAVQKRLPDGKLKDRLPPKFRAARFATGQQVRQISYFRFVERDDAEKKYHITHLL
jgi:hypothetical protein